MTAKRKADQRCFSCGREGRIKSLKNSLTLLERDSRFASQQPGARGSEPLYQGLEQHQRALAQIVNDHHRGIHANLQGAGIAPHQWQSRIDTKNGGSHRGIVAKNREQCCPLCTGLFR